MRKLAVFIMSLTFVLLSSFAHAGQWDNVNPPNSYMSGHPVYNENYYNPQSSQQPNSPNYNPNYYNNNYNNNGNYGSQQNSAPHGNDIRDYNPYYDRNGNLK